MVDQKILIAAGVVVALIIAYIALSFSSLEYNEYGLDYSGIWKEVDTEFYTGGIHFIGFQHSFIKFPKSVITIDFSDSSSADHDIIESRTLDGLEVNLEISFQYELQPKKLYKLYMDYGEQYEEVMIKIVMDSINKVSNTYTAYNFFTDRAVISEDMEEEVELALNTTMHTVIKFFQLKNVDLPNSFEDAIQLTEVKKQDIDKAEAERSKVLVEIETRLQLAEQNTLIILNHATGVVNTITSQNTAHVNAYNFTEQNIVDGYTNLKVDANLSNPGLLEYIKADIIQNYEGDNLIISLSD